MAYPVVFNKSTSIHGGVNKIEIKDDRAIVTYSDNTTLDVGPASGISSTETAGLSIKNGVLSIIDSSKIRDYEELYEKLSLAGDDSEIIIPKTFNCKDTDGNVTGSVIISCGVGASPTITIQKDSDNSVTLDYDKLKALLDLLNE